MLYEMGLATVMVCCVFLAAFIATSVLSREIENKTALTVISKPVGRPIFILGKYFGVSGAILIAGLILTTFFLFALRHRVMSTARDTLDGPVVLFSTLAVLLPIALAIWGNYFYGWVFSSTAVFWMLPAVLIAYAITLTISKEWAFQSITTDLKTQVLLTAACSMIAILVLTAVAVTASTRLGQVMTIVVCAGVFILGLLSNHLLGRHAFQNEHLGIVRTVTIEEGVTLAKAGDRATINLKATPRITLTPGMPIYYAIDPSGISMEVPRQQPFEGNPAESEDLRSGKFPPALVIRDLGADNAITLVNVSGLPVRRPPAINDYIFAKPTAIYPPAFAAWAVVPNLQAFWLVDAVTQGHKIPPRYIALISAYGAAQITACLALAIMLFQRRDVG
jgi:ABC-type transport system involved in multi-copper enzyme maturation permease subunit